VDTILLLASIAYAIAATAYYLAGARSVTSPETQKVARAAILAGACMHLLDVILGSIRIHHCPVTSTQFAASMTGLTTVVIFLILATRAHIEPLGAIVAPIGLVSLISSEFMHRGATGTDTSKLWLAIHVTSNVLGVGLFLVSAGVGAAYLAQAARLKAKRADARDRQFPGLLPLEMLMRRLLIIGFVPLSVGVITGAAFADRVRLGGLDAMRIAFAYGVWLLAGIMIFGGRVAGWRGRKIAMGNIVGALISVLVVVMYVLSPSLVMGGR
jgi:ABC-type uncharacterized transport system permease subunit